MKSFLTLQQLQKRQQQLINLIAKFPTVRSAVRRWGFELTLVEGMIERNTQSNKAERGVMLVDEFIEKINYVPGFSASRWQKHGMDRVYLNKINGKAESSFLNVSPDGILTMGKYFCPLSIEELFSLAANAVKPDPSEEKEGVESRIIYTSKWEWVGSGHVRTIRWTDGKKTWETIDTKGDVSQFDLDDYFG